MYKRLHVSMIAPAKRGVPVLLHVFAVEIISIHAPVWGASIDLIASEAWLSFQFTPRVGAGGALCPGSTRAPNFNSRPRVGAGSKFA